MNRLFIQDLPISDEAAGLVHRLLNLKQKSKHMDIRQLKYFVTAAETLNFSEASKRLCITQSTLSQQIATLEHELGQQLLQRNSHEMLLTEAGEMLLPLARKALRDVEDCQVRVQELNGLMTGELNIGVTFSFSSIATETIMDFLKEYPNVKMTVYYATMDKLMNDLLHHKLDILLAYSPLKCDRRIESRPLFCSHLSAIVNDHHPLSQKPSVTLEELSRYNLALPLHGMQARNAFDNMTAHRDIPFKVKVEMGNVGLIFRIIRESNYVTVLSEATLKDEPDLRAIPIAADGNEMTGCVHLLKDAYMKHSAREFIQRLIKSISVFRAAVLSEM